MLVDEIEITLKAGHGGAGKVSFYPKEKAGPDGGNGGRGGDLYIKVTSDLTALNQYINKVVLDAENGEPGGGFLRSGKDGKDATFTFPVGSLLTDTQTGEQIELTKVDETLLICKGGLGGKGNAEFKSSRRTTPKFAQKGLPGEEKHFSIVLRLIADFGLIGLPNAGKSSLLNELTAANAKVASYPFTTLEPNLGVVEGKILADIPGLIEGASEGKGLGIKFLKHIEKVGLLIHCISAESDDITRDYKVVRNELENFNPELLEKKEIILLTKSDLVDPKEIEKIIKKLNKFQKSVYSVSIYDWDSLQKLKSSLFPG